MPTCSRAPMIGRRVRYGDFMRTAKLRDRKAIAADIAGELIAEFAIEPATPSPVVEDDFDDWLARWDDFDVDPFPYDEIGRDWSIIDELPDIEGREALDTDDLPGWGTHIDWEDLAGLTITNRPYGFTGYGQRDR